MDPNHTADAQRADVDTIEADIGFERIGTSRRDIEAPLASSIFRDAREPRYDSKGDPSEINAYQQAEFQRRLRGEYESAQRRVGEVVSSSLTHPIHLTSIRIVSPALTTRSGFLDSLLSPFISQRPTSGLRSLVPGFFEVGELYASPVTNPVASSPSATSSSSSSTSSETTFETLPTPPTTLLDLLRTTRSIQAHLLSPSFDIFRPETLDIALQPAPGGSIGDVEMVVKVREKGRMYLKGGTEVGGGEGGANITAKLRNVFGGAESLEVNATFGTKTKHAYQAQLSTPLFASPILNASVSAFSQDRDNTAFASHRERSEGGRAKFSMRAPWGTHDLMYEYVNREIGHLAPKASVSIRELAYPSTKSSLTHTWTKDTRDDPWTGSSGSMLKLVHEIAGLPGSSESVNFFKSTTQSQLSRSLSWPGPGWHYSIGSMTTLLIPLSAGRTRTDLSDRVFLGGPNSVRGWKIGGIGARDHGDSLGGDLAFAMGLSVFAPFPFRPEWPVKLHSFLNLGRVVGWDNDRTFGANISKLYSSPNVSVGLGLLYRLDPVRVEVNFSLPLVGRKGEGWARGLGVGLGLEFL